MSLPVGIHHNIVFSKAERNEKGTLIVGFREAKTVNIMEALNSGSGNTSFSSREQDFMIFPPTVEGYGGTVSSPEDIQKKIAEIVDPLSQILNVYQASSKTKWDLFKNTGINASNINDKLLQQSTLDLIYSNIADQFVAMAAPILASTSIKVRLLLIRASQKKHFPGLRKRFLDANPFIESMDVPAEASRLRFTPFEVKNGLNTGEPIAPTVVVDGDQADAAEKALMS
jgi:hypothetical protein